MKEVIELLREQNELMANHNELFESSLGEFRRILQLQAAEAKLLNARNAIMDETLQKMLASIAELGQNSRKLLAELIK